jgi:hypothetical protein
MNILARLAERWQELKRIYGGDRDREVRHTAIGWQPGEDWIQDPNPPSGSPEFYQVVRAGETEKEYSHEQETSRADRRAGYVRQAR